MRAFWKWPKMAIMQRLWPMQNTQFGSKIKNSLQHAKNLTTNTLELFYAKNGSKKQLIFEKWEHFENGQKWPQSKGYSPCKILSFGQKIKLLKTCQKPLYKHIRNVLCKKRFQKTANNGKMRAFWKWPKMAIMQRLWPMQYTQFGSKIKIPYNMRKTSLQTH